MRMQHSVIRLDEIQGEHREGARFLSRFTKDRNSENEQAALEWSITTTNDGNVEDRTREASSMDVLRQWIEDGLTSAEDIAREMGVSKGTCRNGRNEQSKGGGEKRGGNMHSR